MQRLANHLETGKCYDSVHTVHTTKSNKETFHLDFLAILKRSVWILENLEEIMFPQYYMYSDAFDRLKHI